MKTNYFNKLAIIFFLQLGLATSVSAEATQEHSQAKLIIAKTETGDALFMVDNMERCKPKDTGVESDVISNEEKEDQKEGEDHDQEKCDHDH